MVTLAPALLSLVMLATLMTLMVADPFWRESFSRLFQRLADIDLTGRLHLGSWHPFAFLRTADNYVLLQINRGKRWAERGVVYQFNLLTDSVKLVFGMSEDVALALFHVAKVVGAKVAHTVTHTDVHRITRTITRTVTVVKGVALGRVRAIEHRIDALRARVVHAAHVAAGTLALPFPRIGRLERTVKAQAKRLTRLEKVALGGLGVAAVAAALSRLGLGFLRCRNVQRTGRRVCGMDADLLESLLAASLLLSGSISLRQLARELQEPTRDVTRGLRALVDEF